MKKIPVEKAVGMTLCHDITAMHEGFKGAAYKRGHIIKDEDVEKLLDIGKKSVFVFEEIEGEIHEDDAALRMAAMCDLENCHFTGPSEGKMLAFADCEGLFRVNTQLLQKINSIGDITICSIPDNYPVKVGARLASMRIVPLVTDEKQLEEAESLCKADRLFSLSPYKFKKVGIIITGSEIYSGRIKDRFEPVVRAKMEKFPSEIVGLYICDDDLTMIKAKANELLSAGADFLIFTGGMSVDPDDLTPTAIKELGAEIISYGMPAQPGNMTLVAYLGDIPVLGVPGAAVNLPTTMFDVLLPRIFAEERLTKQDLINMGDGGLCQMCEVCHFPNCTFGRY